MGRGTFTWSVIKGAVQMELEYPGNNGYLSVGIQRRGLMVRARCIIANANGLANDYLLTNYRTSGAKKCNGANHRNLSFQKVNNKLRLTFETTGFCGEKLNLAGSDTLVFAVGINDAIGMHRKDGSARVRWSDGIVASTKKPTKKPTALVTTRPTVFPTIRPIAATTKQPTNRPTVVATTKQPTNRPTVLATTKQPTNEPTFVATTKQPTNEPTVVATTKQPTNKPTFVATTKQPTNEPTTVATRRPTKEPSKPTSGDVPPWMEPVCTCSCKYLVSAPTDTVMNKVVAKRPDTVLQSRQVLSNATFSWRILEDEQVQMVLEYPSVTGHLSICMGKTHCVIGASKSDNPDMDTVGEYQLLDREFNRCETELSKQSFERKNGKVQLGFVAKGFCGKPLNLNGIDRLVFGFSAFNDYDGCDETDETDIEWKPQ